ncbi:MAG: hypothetical protein DRH93_08380 [Deltaproteobacteria bacterium]|nr:MAG: hypothetical protein DRH93_08380 [Deltaproteobacteria bacterium]
MYRGTKQKGDSQMQKNKLHKLEIKNFKGIKSFVFTPDGEDAKVYGDNATGKTTLKDALSWLLTGKDSNGRADFQLKPVDKDGAERHNLETVVGGKMMFGENTISLEKRYYEKWVKTRGKAIKEFSGHTTDHFIDGVPAQKKDFDKKIGDLVDINILPLVSDTQAFNLLHWEKRREVLLDLCGAMTDLDVVATTPEFAPLKAVLEHSTIKDHSKKLKAEQKEINQELDGIPARVSENQNNIIEVAEPDKKEKEKYKKEIEKRRLELAQVQSNEAASKKQILVNEIDAEIDDIGYKHLAKVRDATSDATSKFIEDKMGAQSALNEQLNSLMIQKTNRDGCLTNMKTLTEAMDAKRAEWGDLFKTDITVKDHCHACKQPLPENQVNKTIERLKRQKAEELKEISQEGKKLMAEWEASEGEYQKAITKIKAIEKKVVEGKDRLKAIEDELGGVIVPEIKKPDITLLEKKKAKLVKEIKQAKEGSGTLEKDIGEKIDGLETALEEWRDKRSLFSSSKKAIARIAELEKREKVLAIQYEELEKELNLLDQFVIKKVEISEEQLNDHFELAKFKLFDIQINGGVKECCRTLYDGVPFNRGLNHGAQVNVGLDIIDTLSEYYKFSMPVFIDNAESCTKVANSKSQLIKLIVDENHKKLSWELTQQKGE